MTLEELRVVAREFREAKAIIQDELNKAAERNEFRFSYQMPSWPRYIDADQAWTEALDQFIKEA